MAPNRTRTSPRAPLQSSQASQVTWDVPDVPESSQRRLPAPRRRQSVPQASQSSQPTSQLPQAFVGDLGPLVPDDIPEFEPLFILPRDSEPHLPDDVTSAIDVFELFFTDVVMDHIVCHTNEQAERKASRKSGNERAWWKDLTVGELRTWLAIYIFQGIQRNPAVPDYWSEKYRSQLVAEGMGRNRFMQISRFLWFSAEPPQGGQKPWDQVRF
jgi:hypothetical protein